MTFSAVCEADSEKEINGLDAGLNGSSTRSHVHPLRGSMFSPRAPLSKSKVSTPTMPCGRPSGAALGDDGLNYVERGLGSEDFFQLVSKFGFGADHDGLIQVANSER